MNRRTTVAVVLGVAGATAAMLALLMPSTGPELEALEADLPPVQAADVAVRASSPSPRPTARKPVRRPDGVPGQGLGPSRELRRREGPLAGGPRGAGRMRVANSLRDRYSEEGHAKIMQRIEGIAADQDWDAATYDKVEAILGESRQRGHELLSEALAEGPTGDKNVAVALKEIRIDEMKALEDLLGAEQASTTAQKAGLVGRRAMVKRPGGGPPVAR